MTTMERAHDYDDADDIARAAGYTNGEGYEPKSPLNTVSKAREIALAVATQLASSVQPGEDIAANVIADANKYLAFLRGDN